jgi:hypothetical protein
VHLETKYVAFCDEMHVMKMDVRLTVVAVVAVCEINGCLEFSKKAPIW